jgi:hypothetical protein
MTAVPCRLDAEALAAAPRSRAVHAAGHLTLAAVLGYPLADVTLAGDGWRCACRLKTPELPSLLRAAFHASGLGAETMLGDDGADLARVIARYQEDAARRRRRGWDDVAMALWRLEGVPQLRRGSGIKFTEHVERLATAAGLALATAPWRTAVADVAGFLEMTGRMTAEQVERRVRVATGGVSWEEAVAELRRRLAVAALHSLEPDPQ